MGQADGFQARRVLVVTEDFSLAGKIDAMLDCAGCAPIGPVWTISDADELALGVELDGAVIDSRQDCAAAVASLLRMLRVPAVLVSNADPFQLAREIGALVPHDPSTRGSTGWPEARLHLWDADDAPAMRKRFAELPQGPVEPHAERGGIGHSLSALHARRQSQATGCG